FPVPSLRVRRRQPQRDGGVSREPGVPPQLPRRDRLLRRRVHVYPLMATDLLVFGPHPDDLEIGLGASIAEHVSLGIQVGLFDLTQGEMGTNGTVEERLAEAERARAVLGAAWRENLRWPDRRIGKDPGHLDHAVEFIRRHQPKTIAIPYWQD